MNWIKFVDKAIKNYVCEVQNNRLVILTESDFKVGLTTEIRKILGAAYSNITVNTESPWYDEDSPKQPYYIDITVFDTNLLNISYSPKLNRKGYKYEHEAIVIELKYFRYETDIKEIEKDFQKIKVLLKSPKNFCYIVALARTDEILLKAKNYMENWVVKYELNSNDRVKVYLLDESQLMELSTVPAI